MSRWAKYHDIKSASFIHDNTLLLGGDNALTFINLSNGNSTLQTITGKIGEGVSCFVGHKLYDIFAFSEASLNPRIILYSHPELKPISNFQSTTNLIFLQKCKV